MLWHLLWTLLTGAVVGWLAGVIMKKPGTFGRNIILGIAGSAVGGLLSGLLGIYGRGLGSLIISVIGACLCLYLADRLGK
jgi:uncharacterized membrane protein YeaQ/YmgE (transglycosylase-associated protein family)